MSDMIKLVQEILLPLLTAGVVIIGAIVLKTRKDQIIGVINDLIHKAEVAIKGSNMGEAKKQMVIDQLTAIGIKITPWVSAKIDAMVKYLNDTGSWLIDTTVDKLSEELTKVVSIANSNAALLTIHNETDKTPVVESTDKKTKTTKRNTTKE